MDEGSALGWQTVNRNHTIVGDVASNGYLSLEIHANYFHEAKQGNKGKWVFTMNECAHEASHR